MTPTEKKIDEALSRPVCGGWDRDFLQSILGQLSKGRTLSSKQKQTLGKVLARNTQEDQSMHDRWQEDYMNHYQADAVVLAEYHARQAYYKPMAADILNRKVPQRARFLRMYNNKYSQKVLAEQKKEAKYGLSAHVGPRSTFNAYKHVEAQDLAWTDRSTSIDRFKRHGGFVLEILRDVYSHAKGSKRYKILPIGATIPLIIEERHLKLARKR
jgi:hypothetical protein